VGANIIIYFKRLLIVLSILLIAGNAYGLRLPQVPAERCVSIHGVICEDEDAFFKPKKETNLLELTQKLIELDRTPGDIRIYLHSIGGVVSTGLSIIDTIKSLKNDVQILCHGNASSLAMYILSVGTKGKRAITEHTQILVHKAQYADEPNYPPFYPYYQPAPGEEEEGEESWTEEEQERWREEKWRQNYLRAIQIIMDDILYKHTKVTPKEMAEWDNDIIFADTIIKYEIADGIYEGEK